MRLIANSCPDGPCPRIYLRDDGDVVVQGYDDTSLMTPAGESLVRIPSWLVLHAADALRAAQPT